MEHAAASMDRAIYPKDQTKGDVEVLANVLANLARLARRWRRSCGRAGGACVQQEESNRRADEERKMCAYEIEELIKKVTR
jgi:hypothetical protein